MTSLKKTILLLTFFSIAMGFMESAVVIYLRELYYPTGFKFPLVPIPAAIALTEFLREAATLIMLVTIGLIAGKNTTQRFCFFLFCFAVWDIFYYIFLKLFLNWPESIFTPDILFLIPVPWVGPVIAPCIASLTMIILMLLIVHYHEKNIFVTINRKEWFLMIAGTLVMITAFTQDYFNYISNNHTSAWNPAGEHKLFEEFLNYVPQSFNWTLFLAGELLLLAAIIYMRRRFFVGNVRREEV
jgi:hypothetical protein